MATSAIFHPEATGRSILLAAVRLINLGHGTDEESATAYWQRVGGELLGEQGATHSLVLGFLIGAISTACQIDQTGGPVPTRNRTENRAPREVGSTRNIRATGSMRGCRVANPSCSPSRSLAARSAYPRAASVLATPCTTLIVACN